MYVIQLYINRLLDRLKVQSCSQGKLVQICTQPYQMEVLIDNDTTTEEQGFTKCVKCKRICCDQ